MNRTCMLACIHAQKHRIRVPAYWYRLCDCFLGREEGRKKKEGDRKEKQNRKK